MEKGGGGTFQAAKLQRFEYWQTALPATNRVTSKGLIMAKPAENGKGMGKILSPVQSSVE